VTERDPFGRLPNEDPLAGLGSRTNGTERLAASEPAASKPAATDQSPEKEAIPDRPRPPTSRRSIVASRLNPSQVADAGRWIVRAVVIVGVLVTIAGVAGTLLLAGKSVPDEVSDAPAPRIAADRPLPRGLDPRSLLLRRNLVPALRRVRGSGLGQLRTLRVAPERIDATLLARGGSLRAVRVRFDGRLSSLGATRASGAAAGRPPTIPFSRVDATAPSQLARGAAARVRRPVTAVDFVLLRNAGSSAPWTVVMRGGRRLRGDTRGRITGRTG
jgi:hypothetical protein